MNELSSEKKKGYIARLFQKIIRQYYYYVIFFSNQYYTKLAKMTSADAVTIFRNTLGDGSNIRGTDTRAERRSLNYGQY